MPIDLKLPEWRAAPLWDELMGWLSREFPRHDYPLPVVDWWPLYCQALLAHDAGAREASAMTCRAALESIGWTFLTYKPMNPGKSTAWWTDPPKDRKGNLLWPIFGAIRDRLVEEQVLTVELLKGFDRIKDDGDEAAHISERSYEKLQSLVKTPTGTPGQRLDWMTDAQARMNLEQALEIFKRILLAAESTLRGKV